MPRVLVSLNILRACLILQDKPIETIIAEFETDAYKGLSQAEAKMRFERDGPNELEKPPRVRTKGKKRETTTCAK